MSHDCDGELRYLLEMKETLEIHEDQAVCPPPPPSLTHHISAAPQLLTHILGIEAFQKPAAFSSTVLDCMGWGNLYMVDRSSLGQALNLRMVAGQCSRLRLLLYLQSDGLHHVSSVQRWHSSA